jgi:hypothetical protein
VSLFTGCSPEEGERALLKSIYKLDAIDDATWTAPKSAHITAFIPSPEEQHLQQRVLPVAILLGTGKFTVQSAQEALDGEPVVRNLIAANTSTGGTSA